MNTEKLRTELDNCEDGFEWLVAALIYSDLPWSHPLKGCAYLTYRGTFKCSRRDVLALIEYLELEQKEVQDAQQA